MCWDKTTKLNVIKLTNGLGMFQAIQSVKESDLLYSSWACTGRSHTGRYTEQNWLQRMDWMDHHECDCRHKVWEYHGQLQTVQHTRKSWSSIRMLATNTPGVSDVKSSSNVRSVPEYNSYSNDTGFFPPGKSTNRWGAATVGLLVLARVAAENFCFTAAKLFRSPVYTGEPSTQQHVRNNEMTSNKLKNQTLIEKYAV